MRILKFLTRLVLAITLASVVAKANAQSIDELYQAAKKEGALSLNGGGLAGLYEPWVREFEQRFPGIKVTLTADFSNILAPIIDREIAERKLSVDLTIFQTLQDYDRWKKQGVLMSFKPEGWDQIDQSFKDPDGQYVGVSVYALSYAYNTQAIAGIDVPRSAQDFLKPEFNGKVITCYPNDDDVTLYLFYTIVQKYGWEFMDKYMANNPQWVRGHLGAARAVSPADLAANDGDLQGCPTPERGQTLHHLVPGEGTAKPNRHLVDALGCSSTVRSQADIRVSTCQRLSQLHH